MPITDPASLTREQIVNDMSVLKGTQGWAIIVQILTDAYLVPLRNKLEGKDKDDPIKDLNDMHRTQDKLAMISWLINIPDELLVDDAAGGVGERENNDPYATTVDEINETIDNENKAAADHLKAEPGR